MKKQLTLTGVFLFYVALCRKIKWLVTNKEKQSPWKITLKKNSTDNFNQYIGLMCSISKYLIFDIIISKLSTNLSLIQGKVLGIRLPVFASYRQLLLERMKHLYVNLDNYILEINTKYNICAQKFTNNYCTAHQIFTRWTSIHNQYSD